MYSGEKLNSISHLLGTVFSLMGFGALIAIGIEIGDPWVITSFSIFGFSLVLLYSMSTLYHSFQHTRIKKIFKVLDHIAIYLLIAGTYTPFMLVTLREGNGWLIMGVIWTLAFIGTLSEIFLKGKAVKVCQLIIYLSMGWACAFDMANLRENLSETGFDWLAAGGIVYTIGVVFYILDKARVLAHAHGIWHVFVLLGSLCHFVAVIGYVR